MKAGGGPMPPDSLNPRNIAGAEMARSAISAAIGMKFVKPPLPGEADPEGAGAGDGTGAPGSWLGSGEA